MKITIKAGDKCTHGAMWVLDTETNTMELDCAQCTMKMVGAYAGVRRGRYNLLLKTRSED